jgi:hypothetical protein
MRRLLVVALAVATLSGCATSGTAPGSGGSTGGPVPTGPSGQPQIVASYQVGGGFVPFGWSLMEGPRLVVYSDGLAIADASTSLVLEAKELADLRAGLRRELDGFGPTASAGAENQIADAPTTVLRVRRDDGTLYQVSAYALSEATGYDPRLVAGKDRMETLTERIRKDGAPYRGKEVRLVAQRLDKADGPVTDWPDGVPVPPSAGEGTAVRKGDFDGAQAEAIAATVPATWRTGPWPVLKADDGTLYGVAWRYLVPDE